MTEVRQKMRGSSVENNTYTGPSGQITVDTTENDLRIHDGIVAGGHRIPNLNFIDNRYAAQFATLGDYTSLAARVTAIEQPDWVTSARILNGTIATVDLADNAVTNAKLADMAAYTMKFRNAATAGDPVDLRLDELDAVDTVVGTEVLASDDLMLVADISEANKLIQATIADIVAAGSSGGSVGGGGGGYLRQIRTGSIGYSQTWYDISADFGFTTADGAPNGYYYMSCEKSTGGLHGQVRATDGTVMGSNAAPVSNTNIVVVQTDYGVGWMVVDDGGTPAIPTWYADKKWSGEFYSSTSPHAWIGE